MLSQQLLILGFTAWTVLRRRCWTVLGPLSDAFQCVHHSAHEDGAEEVLEWTEDVGIEEQGKETDDDEEDDDGKMHKFNGKINQTVIEQDERNGSHGTRLCQPSNHNNHYTGYYYNYTTG